MDWPTLGYDGSVAIVEMTSASEVLFEVQLGYLDAWRPGALTSRCRRAGSRRWCGAIHPPDAAGVGMRAMKATICWTGADGQPRCSLLDIDVCADQVMKGQASFKNPDADTARALNRAKERAAQKLDDEARNRRETYNEHWLRGQSRLETIQLLGHVMRERNRE
jgi:hypothetical protein